MFKPLINTDIFGNLAKKIDSYDQGYKRAIVWCFFTCIVGYGFQLTHVIMSPDMYFEIVTGNSYKVNVSGRWFMAFLRNIALGDHRIVPTFNLFIALILFIISSLLIAKFWRIKRGLYVYFIVTIITLNTFTNHILRWENANIEAGATTLIAIVALYLSGQNKRLFWVALILMTCAHGGYQTGIAVSCAAMFAGLALWLVQDGNFKNLSQYIKRKIMPAILVFLVGFVLHKVILSLTLRMLQLEKLSRLREIHVPHNLSELMGNISLALSSIPPLFTYQVVYFNSQITLIYKFFLILLVAFIVFFIMRKFAWEKVLLVLTLIALAFAAMISTFLPTIAVGYMGISNRILYPVSVFHCLIILIVLESQEKFLKNLAIIGAFCIVFFFSWHNNMYAYRSYLQDRADFDLANRIITRIENLPEYSKYYGKPIKVAVIGTKNISLHGYSFSSSPYQKILNMGAFQQTWSAEGIFNYFHFPHVSVRKGNFDKDDINLNLAKAIVQMDEWPSPKSVALIDGIAIIMMDKSAVSSDILEVLFQEFNTNDRNTIDLNMLKLNLQISQSGSFREYEVSGIDPFMIFSLPQHEEDKLYIVHTEIKLPSPTVVQLFFQTKRDPRWTQTQSTKCFESSTSSSCYFYLEGNKINGNLRLDPGVTPGKYRIEKIEIREISRAQLYNN